MVLLFARNEYTHSKISTPILTLQNQVMTSIGQELKHKHLKCQQAFHNLKISYNDREIQTLNPRITKSSRDKSKTYKIQTLKASNKHSII